jgi:hypothetical protein
MTDFQLRPSFPTAELIAAARAEALSTLNAGRAAAPAIAVGDRVSVFPAGALEARTATVEAVREDGMYLVHFAFGATKWVFERDVTLLATRETAAELAVAS